MERWVDFRRGEGSFFLKMLIINNFGKKRVKKVDFWVWVPNTMSSMHEERLIRLPSCTISLTGRGCSGFHKTFD